MAKIVRYNGNLQAFASGAIGTERTLFGEVTQANDLTSQITPDFLRGWGIVGPSDQPALEDFNGAMYTHGQLLAYLHQVGIAEYNATQEYHLGSMVNSGGSIFVSRINTNIGNAPISSPANWRNLDVAGAPPGAKNARMLVTAGSASATFTADEVVVKSALGGNSYALSAFSKVINLATVGAGGMDVGLAPATGFVALYAIYNPTTGLSALLATDCTAVVAPEIYGGANMPTGYTASALLSVWLTSASRLFVSGYQQDRNIVMQDTLILSTSTQQAAVVPLSVAAGVPANAKTVSGVVDVKSSTANAVGIIRLYATDSPLMGQQVVYTVLPSATISFAANFLKMPILLSRSIYYLATVSAGTMSLNITVNGYTF